MINHVTDLPTTKIAIGIYRIPVFFIHMVTWLYFGMLLAEFYGTFRITFYIEAVALGKTGKQE